MSFRVRYATAVLLALVAVSGCSRKKIKVDATNVAKKNDFVMWADWVKDKGTRYDVSFNFRNDGERHAIFYLDELECYRGTTAGELKHTFFNTGHRTFKAHPHHPDHSNMVCKVSGTGAFRIVLSHVYDNPNGDGITRGDVLAENLEWVQADDSAPAVKEDK
jgi:hypothetical protein